MGICILRSADQHEKGPERVRAVPQGPAEGRFLPAAVFHLHAALQLPRERRRPYQKGQILPARKRGGDHLHPNRQAVRHDGVLPFVGAGEQTLHAPATGTVLNQKENMLLPEKKKPSRCFRNGLTQPVFSS